MRLQIKNTENEYPNYDEYNYDIGNIEHSPFEIISYLTAVYQDFKFNNIKKDLRDIFDMKYCLNYSGSIKIDTETGDEIKVLNINLKALPFSDVVYPLMDDEQKQIYDATLLTKGNRQYISSVLPIDWIAHVSSYYGYRVSPIDGTKNLHTAIDIAVSQGTEILAGHDGVITKSGRSTDGALVVEIKGTTSDDKEIITKYAHCSRLLVSVGQTVKAGEVIAKVGNTGISTGAHLHFELTVDGKGMNPLYFTKT